MNKFFFILFLGIAGVLTAFRTINSDHIEYPESWPKPAFDFSNNPVTKEGFELGRRLFHDMKLSRDGSVSCASCHSQFNAFTHVDHKVSHGVDDRKGTRNSPVLINLAWNTSFHWDGGVNHLEVQPINPITHPAEMDNSLENIIAYLNAERSYKEEFRTVFGDTVITTKHMLKAMAQYTVSLVSSNSKYDQYKRGEIDFTEQELKGEKLFMKHCNSCHTAPLFNSNRFANNGLSIDTTYNDVGRYKITENGKDSLQFRVPTLRNIAYSFPYMHDGRLSKLQDVVEHYVSGIDYTDKYLSEELKQPISLNGNEKKDLLAFLLTLTDREFLFNPKFGMPR